MKNSSPKLPLYACLLLIAACEKDADTVVYDDDALADEAQTANWLAYGRTHNERRFSPSAQINDDNVADLRAAVAHARQAGDATPASGALYGFGATPQGVLALDGLLSAGLDLMYALPPRD